MAKSLQRVIRDQLEEMREYEYSDGCVLFWGKFCTPEEWSRIEKGEGGMLDTLARVLAEAVA